MMKKLFLYAALLCTANAALAGDGTPLSAKGAGAFTSFASAYSVGMGNAGMALIGSGFLSRVNPATWSALEDVQFGATYGFSGVSSHDNVMNESSYYSNGNFAGGIFALPVDRTLGISIAGGFTPLTSHYYEISSSIDSAVATPAATYHNTGNGGLGEGFVGASFSPFGGLRIGGMFQYAFGRTETVGQVNFSNTDYQSSYSDYSTYLQGSGGSFGFILSDIDKLTKLSFLSGLNIAGYYKLHYRLNGTNELQNIYSDGLDTSFTSTATGYIPPEFGMGFAKSFNRNLSVVLDVRAQQLSKYEDSFTPQGSLKDVLFIGGGVQYLQGREIGSLFDKRILRAGLYYEKTQFVLPTKSGQDRQVDELFLTAGVEMPISYSAAVNVSAQYGLRGLSSDFLLREQVFRLYVSVTMGEVWFIRPVGD